MLRVLYYRHSPLLYLQAFTTGNWFSKKIECKLSEAGKWVCSIVHIQPRESVRSRTLINVVRPSWQCRAYAHSDSFDFVDHISIMCGFGSVMFQSAVTKAANDTTGGALNQGMLKPLVDTKQGRRDYVTVWQHFWKRYDTVIDLGAGFAVWLIIAVLQNLDNSKFRAYGCEVAKESLEAGAKLIAAVGEIVPEVCERVVFVDSNMLRWQPPPSIKRDISVFTYCNLHSFRFQKEGFVEKLMEKITSCYPPTDLLTTDSISYHGVGANSLSVAARRTERAVTLRHAHYRSVQREGYNCLGSLFDIVPNVTSTQRYVIYFGISLNVLYVVNTCIVAGLTTKWDVHGMRVTQNFFSTRFV